MGKTAIAEFVIRYLKDSTTGKPQISALKVTTRHSEGCSKSSCHVCDSIKYPFETLNDKDVIEKKGKDTARLRNAGAENVVWLQSFPETLKDGINAALKSFAPDDIVVVEGNSFLSAHEVDFAIFVARPGVTTIKKSAKSAISKIDLVVINSDKSTTQSQITETQQWLETIGITATSIQIDPFIDDPTLLKGSPINKIL